MSQLRKLLALAVCFATVGFEAVSAEDHKHLPEITAVRYSVSHGALRIFLDIDKVPPFTVFTAVHPDRLIVDFPPIRWKIAEEMQTADVTAMRYGLFRQDRSRLIFDLTRPLRVEQVFSKPPSGSEPARLVIDLAATTRADFEKRAGAPEAARWTDQREPESPRNDGALIIAIDPGHGGVDPGASGGDLIEKVVVLEFAERFAAAINARDGLAAFLTRDSDEFVPLAERIARAHAARASVFISIHADSVEAGSANGMSVYTLSDEASDQAADLFAARENRSDVLGGADLFGESDALTRLLVELAQRGTDDESSKLARSLVKQLDRNVELLRSRPLRSGNFRVLKAPDLPSVLVELGFLDNATDRKRLVDPVWQERAARGLVEGIAAWRKIASPGFIQPR